MDWQLYDYYLPEKNLALKPEIPRDHSKIFVYFTKTDEIIFDIFFNIDKYLSKDNFLVLNNTKVVPVRIEMKKQTGGKVVSLFLINEYQGDKKIQFLVDRKINIGEKIYFKNGEFIKVLEQNKNIFTGKFNFDDKKLFELFFKYGSMPIPLYLKNTPLKKSELKERYQTVFAKNIGSVAAPTASLHFTKRVFNKLEKIGIKKYYVTLHVGLGTFASINESNIKNKSLHEEYYQVEDEVWKNINLLKTQGKKLVAVGTTVVRTLESKVRRRNFLTQWRPLHPKSSKNLSPSSFSKTNLFIFPPFNFQMIDCLITNFHLPKSSLMMLVEAFLQYKKAKRHLIDLYKIAIKNNFRFYSFGDAMVII